MSSETLEQTIRLEPRILIVQGVPMATSLAIAEQFDREHRNVLRDIREAMDKHGDDREFCAAHFQPSEHIDARGKRQPIYRLTETGFSLVAFGFTGTKAAVWQRLYVRTFIAMRDGHGPLLAEKQALRNEVARLKAENNALIRVKTRWVTDQHRVSSAEVELRLIYALNPSEGAVLWLLIQLNGLAKYDRGIKISVRELLKLLHPHIKTPSTITQAASRLAARGLVTVSTGHPMAYAVHLERVIALLDEYDAKWLGIREDYAPHLIPGLTDWECNKGEAAMRFDVLLPKSPATLIRHVGPTLPVAAVVPEEWWSLERAFRMLPDRLTGANAVELNDSDRIKLSTGDTDDKDDKK